MLQSDLLIKAGTASSIFISSVNLVTLCLNVEKRNLINVTTIGDVGKLNNKKNDCFIIFIFST